MTRRYTSFDQIEYDIRRLHLQTQIDKEELKLSLRQSKESITPSKIATNFLGGIATSTVLVKLFTPIASFAIGKLLAKYVGK